ncbi:MAG: carbohydrate ABC transporter permease [Alphaproteobacteria bacterium]|nr:carbohydrate ABC transporter permease [Alphaproteobacteria bacterium]
MTKFLKIGGKAILILLIVVWSIFPVAYVVLNSFKFQRDIFAFPPSAFFTPTLGNYADLLSKYPDFFGFVVNSLFIAVLATLLSVFAAACAGYVYSRFRSTALSASAFYLVAVRLLPPLVITIPLFPWVNQLGLADSHVILILLYATFWVPLNVLIMKEFIDQIPKELDESATVDGAGEGQILRYVVAPLAKQGMVACAVFVFVFAWNEYVYAFIFTIQNAKTTPLILSELMDSVTGTNYGILFAAATVQLVPILIVVLALQRFLVAGLTAGAVKG